MAPPSSLDSDSNSSLSMKAHSDSGGAPHVSVIVLGQDSFQVRFYIVIVFKEGSKGIRQLTISYFWLKCLDITSFKLGI